MEKHIEKVKKLEEHLKEHPTDYQAVIAHLKARSDAIDYAQKRKLIERHKRIAEIRRKRHAEKLGQ